MENNWYCNMSGDVSGPLTDVQLRELAAGGHLLPDDFVRKTEVGEWVSAGRVNGLFPTVESSKQTSEEAGHLPVAKAVGGPPPIPRPKPPTIPSETSPRDVLFTIDTTKTRASARSGFRKRRRRLITSPPVLAISTALIVLAGAIYWLSRTATEPVRSGEDVSAVEARAGPTEAKSARQATFDAMKGLDADELDRVISKPSDDRSTRETDTAVKSRQADEPIMPLEPEMPERREYRETMVKVLEDDGYSPIPIPGLTDVNDDDNNDERSNDLER